MPQAEPYVDLKGTTYALSTLDQQELAAIERFQEFAEKAPEWSAYRNFWMTEVDTLYMPRGMSRRDMLGTVVYRVGQDIGSRLGIAQGRMRQLDEPPIAAQSQSHEW